MNGRPMTSGSSRSTNDRPQDRTPTMRDVARTAGVSLGTVSHVLSGAHYVRPETHARVESAIEQLGFRPNRVARSLVRRRTNTVGFVLPDIANPFFAELARGAEDILSEADYAAVLGNSDNDRVKEGRYLSSFGERGVDGLIVALSAASHAEDVRGLAERIPTVIVDRIVTGWKGDSVVGDNRTGMGLAVQHLAGLGHKQLALINGDARLSTATERRLGFARAVAAEGIVDVSYSDGAFTFESGYEQAVALLDRADRPTAACAANDLLALAVLSAASDRGCHVPDEMSVVGYDDITYARLASPSLTTVRQPAYEMGAAAARLLLERLRDERTVPRRLVVKPQLMVRGSTAAPRAGR
jgi:LacI family transcriptional regulator